MQAMIKLIAVCTIFAANVYGMDSKECMQTALQDDAKTEISQVCSTSDQSLENQLEQFRGIIRETSLLQSSAPDITRFILSKKLISLRALIQQQAHHDKPLNSLLFYGPDLRGVLGKYKVALAKWFAIQAGLDYIHMNAADFRLYDLRSVLNLLHELFLFAEHNTRKCALIVENIEQIAQPMVDKPLERTSQLSERQSTLLRAFINQICEHAEKFMIIGLCDNPYLSMGLFAHFSDMFFFYSHEGQIKVS